MLSVNQISKTINGEIFGDKDFIVHGVCDIENGKKNHISYIGSKNYDKYLKDSNAPVVIVNSDFKIDNNRIYIKVKNPSISFIKVMNLFYPKNNRDKSKICKTSIIHKTAKIGKNVLIGSYVIIKDNVLIGDNVEIYSGSYVGENTIIKNNTVIFSNVSIYNNCNIGNNCKIDAGTVIGANGFGLTKDKNKNISFPHIGGVIIKDDVFIGANCCIDRGTMKDTIIGENSRLDNLIQIAHNVKIGKGCIIAAQVGIAGSSILENYVTIAGQVGIIDHIVIGEKTTITGKSFVCRSTKKESFLSGNPAQSHRDFLKQQVFLRNYKNKK